MLLCRSDCRSIMYTKGDKRSNENACDKKEFEKIEVTRPHSDTLQIPDARQLLGEMTANP
jgi:hypothetical protein